ncbi:MAG: ribonuclease E/G [Pseudomonadota bacterium]
MDEIWVETSPFAYWLVRRSGKELTDAVCVPLDRGSAPLSSIWQAPIVRADAGAVYADLGAAGLARLADAPELGPRPSEGARVLLEVVKEAQNGKGPAADGRVSLTTRDLVLKRGLVGGRVSKTLSTGDAHAACQARVSGLAATLPPGWGLILRSGADLNRPSLDDQRDWLVERAEALTGAPDAGRVRLTEPEEALISAPMALLALGPALLRVDARSAQGLAGRLARVGWMADDTCLEVEAVPPSAIAEEAVAETLDGLVEPVVGLPGGGHLLVEPGRTLTALDVNSGSVPGGEPAPDGRALNRAAARCIPQLVRLRGLSGLIAIDFADVSKRAEKEALIAHLREGFAADPARIGVGGFAIGGLMALTRSRSRAPLHEALAGRRAVAHRLALRLTREAAANPGRAWSVRAAPTLCAWLESDGDEGLRALRDRVRLALVADPQVPLEVPALIAQG